MIFKKKVALAPDKTDEGKPVDADAPTDEATPPKKDDEPSEPGEVTGIVRLALSTLDESLASKRAARVSAQKTARSSQKLTADQVKALGLTANKG